MAHSLRPSLQRKTAFWALKVHCAIGSSFQICSKRYCQQLYVVNKWHQTELCALLAMRTLIANSYTSWRGIFKGLSQDRGRTVFADNLRASPSNYDPSNESTFRASISYPGCFGKEDPYLWITDSVADPDTF